MRHKLEARATMGVFLGFVSGIKGFLISSKNCNSKQGLLVSGSKAAGSFVTVSPRTFRERGEASVDYANQGLCNRPSDW